MFQQYHDEFDSFHPVINAARLHRDMVFIHPFGDGNGRMARLAINATFIQNGYLPVMIPPVIRRQYLNFLEEARISNDSFFRFIAERQYETVTHFLRFIEPEKVELYFSIHDGSEKKDKPEHHSATGRNPKP